MTRISRFAVPFAAALALLGSATVVHAQSATLAWDANTEPNISGYRLYYGTKSHTYSKTVDVGNVTTYKVSGLDVSQNYFFALQAYNTAGLSSGLSGEVELPAPVPPGTTVIKSLTANKNFPLLFGTPVTFTANATSTMGQVEYRFLLYSPQGAGWTELQAYSSNSSVTWTPAWRDIGSHIVQVWARTVGSPATYEAWRNTNTFTVNANPLQISTDTDFPTPPGNPVHWHAEVAGAGSTQLEYKYVALNKNTGVWSMLRDYDTASDFTWTPTKVATYQLQVWARQVGSTAAYDVWGGYGPFSVAKTPLSVSLSVDTKLPTTTGTTMTWTARAKGGSKGPIEYQFLRWTAASGWTVVQSYSTDTTWVWTPQWGDQGTYVIEVFVRNNGSTAVWDAWTGTNYFDVKLAPIQITADTAFPVPPGTSVRFTAQIADPSAAFEYEFLQYDRSTGMWSVPQAYSTSNTFTWTPSSTGTFMFQVWARRVGSTAAYEVWRGTDSLNVAIGPAHVVSLTADTAFPASSGTAITWTAVANGGTASPLQYRWVLYDGVSWTELRAYSTSNTITWTPSSGGKYTLQVWVRSSGSTAGYEDWKSSGTFVIQ